ncbi:protein NRT1/ PTR FAMILY 5.10-like [Hordeum vulgare subsp. vulgare]|uniref:protein NRT1/ PTR FAMILY 5.10-like n=1 Tax=Hordeum vulgare subsp. vulgare TaxID=112509 RepID=UPI001D1A5285|nr:protein NRT1/ PTR FAMILY 5.10-like [Hordeum vulgare subsp. vulgare]
MAMVDVQAPFLEDKDEPLAGVCDFRGRAVYRSTSGGWRSALFLVVLEVAVIIAYYGVSANLITYLTGPLGYSNAAAATAVNVWTGTARLMPLLGAFVADSWLGRYRSIILANTLYVLGFGMITVASTLLSQGSSTTIDKKSSSRNFSLQVSFFYASLYLIALAQGAGKPCGLAFAADQFDPNHPREFNARRSFFNWWHFSIAIGITFAVIVVSYIQENLGWGIGFGALCAVMICAFGVFLLGSPMYRLHTPIIGSNNPFARLGHAATNFEEARCVLQLLPIWVACLAYGVVIAQIMTLFNKQGRTLDRHIGGLELPPAALQAFWPAAGLLFVPIYDRVLVPALRCTTGTPSGLTLLQRVGTGMVVSLVAMCVAALVETRRLEMAREYNLIDNTRATIPMSWAWLVPQYVMLGVADVFVLVGMQEFFYDQMPIELRSLGIALFYSVMGVGGFISGALISLIDHITCSGGGESWFSDNLNHAHLDYFYWLLAGLSTAELAFYVYVTKTYVYKEKRDS